jgi:prophage maintenance system killer protein
LIRPTLALAVAFNHSTRAEDEWFDKPNDLGRVERALAAIEHIEGPIQAAGVLAFRVTRAQGFGKGNKRTAFLLAKWLLDRNELDGEALLPPADRAFAELLVKAASGLDVEDAIVALLRDRND